MRNILLIIAIVFIGLIAAFWIGFNFNPEKQSNLVYDDDQQGIKDQIVIKFSHVVAENTPKGLAAKRFAKLVEEKTNYRVKVEVFPNGMLYSDKDELDALMEGKVQMISPADSKLTTLFPKWLVLDLPFAFPNYDAITEAFEGKIGQELFSMLKTKNMKGLAFWYNGFKQMTADSPLVTPEDFEGKLFRIMPSDVIKDQFNALGAQTVAMPFNQTYRSLEKGRIDGQENTISNIYSKKFYKVQKNMTISNHGYLGYVVLINNDFWDSLEPSVQQAITEAMNETTEWVKQHAKAINDQDLGKIKQNSDIQVHYLTPSEKQQWMKKFDTVYQDLEKVVGEDLINEAIRIREKYIEQD